MMIVTHSFNPKNLPSPLELQNLINFLHTHLEQYGDKKEDIRKCAEYALAQGDKGGCITTAIVDDELAGVAILNKTGMEGYIPENILVYIATHQAFRGKGVGTALMTKLINENEGDIALHVEPDNPALQLYRKLGFTNKYLEMRLNKANSITSKTKEMHVADNA